MTSDSHMWALSDGEMYFTCAHMCTCSAWGLFIQILPNERSNLGDAITAPSLQGNTPGSNPETLQIACT